MYVPGHMLHIGCGSVGLTLFCAARAPAAKAAATTPNKSFFTRTSPSMFGVIDSIGRQLFRPVVLLFERESRTRLRSDECGDLLSLFVVEAGRVQIRHRISDDAGERINACGSCAIIP